MLVQDAAGAQIQLILASDNKAEAMQLTRDLHASKYAYRVLHLGDRATLLDSLKRVISETGRTVPTVVVVNYNFAGRSSEALLQLANGISQDVAIECVVTSTPLDDGIRRRLKDLGATLFDGDLENISGNLTFH